MDSRFFERKCFVTTSESLLKFMQEQEDDSSLTFDMEKDTKEIFLYRKFNEEVLREVKQECKKYNYCAELRFNEIHIQTKFESWYFVPNECGIIKLMHGNTIGHISERFHKQFSRKMSYKDMVQYIHEHETSKYTNHVFTFTFTKTGGMKAYA